MNRYQFEQLTHAVKGLLIAFVLVLIIGNIINGIIKDTVRVSKESYTLRDGFPQFTSEEAYLKLVKSYPHDFGVRVEVYKMKKGESFWDVARQRRISIDTVIAANPFLKSLESSEGMEVVLPARDGVLLPIDNFTDVRRMRRMLSDCTKVTGQYMHGMFDLFAKDDMRFAFFNGARPAIVNRNLERLYEVRRNYQAPVLGYFSSMFGMRDESGNSDLSFHNGIDISAPLGTPIRPVREGIVSQTGWQDGYGRTVFIQHCDGYVSMYGHLQNIYVEKGQRVEKQKIIGTIGSTGRSTGPHLHFVMTRHGQYINPLLFIW